jgi:hypothetical protein
MTPVDVSRARPRIPLKVNMHEKTILYLYGHANEAQRAAIDAALWAPMTVHWGPDHQPPVQRRRFRSVDFFAMAPFQRASRMVRGEDGGEQ